MAIRKRTMLSLLALLMMTSACTGNEAEPGAAEVPEQGGEKTASLNVDKPVELTVYYMFSGLGREGFMNEIGNLIVKKQPNISFKFLENEQGGNLAGLQYLLTTKQEVDLILGTPPVFSDISEAGLDANIDDLVRNYRYDLGALDSEVLSVLYAAGNGKLPGLPLKTIPLTILYNRDIFDKFGVDYLKDGMTWDEYYNVVRRITREDGGVTYKGFANHQMGGYTSNNQLSLPLIDPKTNKAALDTGGWKTYLENILRFYQIPGIATNADDLKASSGAGAYTKFTKEQSVASILTYASNYPKKSAGIEMNWDAVQYPQFPQAPDTGSMPHMVFMALSATSKHKEEAFKAMAAMTSEEVQLSLARIGVIPVLKNQQKVLEVFGTGTEDLKGRNVKGLIPRKYAAAVPYSKHTQMANGVLGGKLDSVILGSIDLNTALREAAEQVNQEIVKLSQ
ncbi:ABC transporter substrate-binding protein [Paenibacillus sp. GYB004]|uniref:ABC transporter substrate-binding protein n=1 Tax=Paenibacillus sp. GYB004 TaxID=2994393 RepID=UPI002F96A4F8